MTSPAPVILTDRPRPAPIDRLDDGTSGETHGSGDAGQPDADLAGPAAPDQSSDCVETRRTSYPVHNPSHVADGNSLSGHPQRGKSVQRVIESGSWITAQLSELDTRARLFCWSRERILAAIRAIHDGREWRVIR